MEHSGAWSKWNGESLGADGDATIRADLDPGTLAPDVGPPGTARSRTEKIATLLACEIRSGLGSTAQFAVNLLGIAVEAKVVEQGVGGLRADDVFGGKDAGQSALPVEVLALDLAFGLRGAGVAETDAIEVESGAELREGIRALREEEAVAIDVEFEGQAVLAEGVGEEVQIGQKVFAVKDARPRAEPSAVVEEIQ